MKRSLLGAALAAAVLALGVVPAAADYPDRQISLVVPFSSGGTTDILGRLVADQLEERLGATVVVDNRSGAGGTVGSAAVATSDPDGYTLLMSNIASQGVAPALREVPYDPDGDFAHVALVGMVPNAIVVHPSFPAETLGEFMERAKEETVLYGTGGTGTSVHMSGELLKHMTGAKLEHVPYRGAAPARNDVLGNQIPAVIDGITSIAGPVQDGRLRILAVTSPERSALFPDIPTVAEAGVPDYEATAWFGISAPAGTPEAVVETLNAAVREALKDPALAERLRDLGVAPGDLSAAAYTDFVRAELNKWQELAASIDLKLE